MNRRGGEAIIFTAVIVGLLLSAAIIAATAAFKGKPLDSSKKPVAEKQNEVQHTH